MDANNATSAAHALQYLEAAPDAVIAVDESGRIVMANNQANELFGYEGSGLVGKSIESLVPDSARDHHRSDRAKYHSAPRSRPMGDPGSRLRARRADGVLVPVEIALSPVEVDGSTNVIAIVRDVTDRVSAEAEHEVIRQSLDALDDAVFMFDPVTLIFTYANEGAVRQTGYQRSELVGSMTPVDIKPEFTEEQFRRMIAPLTGEHLHSSTFTTLHRAKSGRDIPVEISLSYPETKSTLDRPMVALVRDITERKAAEDRLRASESAFRSAFDEAGVPMAIVDLTDPVDQCVVEANQALADLLGYPLDALPGMSMADLTHPEDRAHDLGGAHEVATDRGGYSTEKRYRTASGAYIWGELRTSLITSPGGEPRSLAHIVDITRRIEAETQRDRREELLMALATIRKSAQNESPTDDVLSLIVEAAQRTLRADHCLIATSTDSEGLICRAVSSPDLRELANRLLPEGALTSAVMKTGKSQTVPNLTFSDIAPHRNEDIGPVVIVPLSVAGSIEGVLIAARGVDDEMFDDGDTSIAAALAAEAAVTQVLESARADRRRMFLAEDRDRIARDLHDLVIQRIFAAGMSLQSALGNPDALPGRVMEAVDELDTTIGVIRESIFQLTRRDDSLGGEIHRLIDRRRSVGRHDITLDVRGDLESIPRSVHDQLLPALNELLSNAERHANADTVTVLLVVDDGHLQLTVTDDGVGIVAQATTGLGLRNLTSRALALGGRMSFGPTPAGSGTEVVWSVPIND